MHCISCTRGYGDYIIGIFEPSFLSFLSPYYLSLFYVPCLKTTLRPLLYIVFDSSHVGNTRAWSEIISQSMMDGELRQWFTLGHTPLISDGFSEATLSTLGHTPLIDDSFLVGWRFALRHSQLVFFTRFMMDWELWDDPTLGHSHFRGHFYWRYSHSTWYSALEHTPLIDDGFFEMMAYFETWLFQRLCVHWGMTLTLFRGHILRHSCLIDDGLWLFIGA